MNKMFRNIMIAVVIVGIAFTAFMCSGSAKTEGEADSTAVQADSTEVVSGGAATDSVAAQ